MYLTKDLIKNIALETGFSLRNQDNGIQDLNPYVYDFVDSMIRDVEKNSLCQLDQRRVRMLAIDAGFKAKMQPSGVYDINPYVFNFSHKILETYCQQKKENKHGN